MTLNTLKLPETLSENQREDVLELKDKISKFKEGIIPEDRFKSFRLTRGVYGQRQLGVQMFRIKIPYGKLKADQLVRIAELSEQYTNGNLHTTTRQNIQLHYVNVEDTPEMWAKLEEVDVTTREACGNTVRTVTGSSLAGIDPDELFDVSPYAEAVTQYFLRNPINQDMGRKVKMAFSSSDKDSAYTYFHDFGFIPRVKQENGKEVRGFKVVVGGGLGAQSKIAETAYEFLPEEKVIPFIEGGLRIFDRYGEREKRMKARLKFLLDEKRGFSLQQYLELIEGEYKALANKTYQIDRNLVPETEIPASFKAPEVSVEDQQKFDLWRKTNVFEQKQKGYYGVHIKLRLGNISSETAKKLSALIEEGVAANDIRITVNQGFLLRFVQEDSLPYLFKRLNELGLAEPGFGTTADVTACPGTDTCNLGVTNSTGVAEILEDLIKEEYPDLVTGNQIHIKISGCMNSCGQHMAANIGLHGSSIKHGKKVVPAMQVVIGGGVDPEGRGFVAEKVIKLPTKRMPQTFRTLFDDYEENATEGEYFNDYYYRQGKMYFYNLLKPLADTSTLVDADYMDWGYNEDFIPEIGTGECAGVMYDMVGIILNDADERMKLSDKVFAKGRYADAIYYAYNSFVIGAKALLLSKDVHCNTHHGIIVDFNKHYYEAGEIKLDQSFESLVYQMKDHEPIKEFAESYRAQAAAFVAQVKTIRQQQQGDEDKVVVDNYYKA
jgi:sulfite reductase (ferredoxin)